LQSADPAEWAETRAGKLFVPCRLSADTAGSADFKWRLFFLYRLDFTILYYIYSMFHTKETSGVKSLLSHIVNL
jgi:hypothetical protein